MTARALLALAAILSACTSSTAPAPPSAACTVAPHRQVGKPSALPLRDIVGLSSHPALGPGADAVAERALEWKALATLGIHRMRTDFRFRTIEPQKGGFDFTQTDPLVKEAAAHGVDLLALLDGTAAWATGEATGADKYPPQDPKDVAVFAAAVASRYQGSIREYEVWNEPNNGFSFWRTPSFSGEPDKYGALYVQTRKALLAAEPCAAVACGSVIYHYFGLSGPDFVAASLQATPDLAPAMDVLSFHPYPLYPPSQSPEDAQGGEVPLLQQIADMDAVLTTAGAKPASLWLTELGWPTFGDVTPQKQASFTVRAILLSALGGADRLYLYTLLDVGQPSDVSPEGDFGLMTRGDVQGQGAAAPQPKASFVAVQTLMATLGGYRVQKRLAASTADTYLLQLTNKTQTAWVAWRANEGETATAVIQTPGSIRVTRLDGTSEDATEALGAYLIKVAQDPIIVTQLP